MTEAKKAEDLFDILDKLAGIDGIDDTFTEEELDNVEPVPLSPGMTERVLAQVRELKRKP